MSALFPPQLISCILEDRLPTADEVEGLATHIWQDISGPGCGHGPAENQRLMAVLSARVALTGFALPVPAADHTRNQKAPLPGPAPVLALAA